MSEYIGIVVCFVVAGSIAGAMVGRPFEALVLAGAVSHACVIGVPDQGGCMSGPTGSGRDA